MGDEGPGPVSTSDLFNGKKVLLFAVPGAFTPGCSMTHLPGYVVNADAIKSKGVDSIVCMSVNDASTTVHLIEFLLNRFISRLGNLRVAQNMETAYLETAQLGMVAA
jgi:hypothetical protein